MKKQLLIAFTGLTLLISGPAHAEILFAPSVSFMNQSLQDNGAPEVTSKNTLLDLRLGYIFDFGLYIGGIYSLLDTKIFGDSSDFHFGPSIGYSYKGFFIAYTHYLFGERDLAVGDIKYANISGYQIDLAYTVAVTKIFSLGPQLTLHDVKYKESQLNGQASASNYKWSGITPQFAFHFKF